MQNKNSFKKREEGDRQTTKSYLAMVVIFSALLFLPFSLVSAFNFPSTSDFSATNNIVFNYTINSSEVLHNELSDLQGGVATEYYHIRQSWYNALNSNLSYLKDYNETNLIVNWSNIIAGSNLNNTGLIKDWSIDIALANTSIKNYADGNFYLKSNPSNFWNSTYAGFNKTYADTLYASIGITSDNSSWNETLANSLYSLKSEPLWTANFTNYNSSWSSTYNSTYDSYNSSGLIKDWNLTGYIFNWNNTGYIKNWQTDIILANTSLYNWITGQNYLTSFTELDPHWSGNYTNYLTLFLWNKTYADSLYSSISEPNSLHLNQNNWFNDSLGYIYWTNSDNRINFNQTKIQTTYYNVSALQVVRGTPSGALGDILTYNDESYNITEQTGATGLDFRVNFTGISTFNQVIFRYKNKAGFSGLVTVQLWDYGKGTWESYATLAELSDFNIKSIGIYDYQNHVQGGIVQLRFDNTANGNTGNVHYFDWVTLTQGLSTSTGAEIDPYSFHKNQNINNTGYNITTDYYFGDGSNINNINTFNSTYNTWAYNQTTASVNILNSSGLIKDWNLTGYIWNWNNTGYIRNWSSIITSDNSSWNQTLANSLYANTQWGYNQTTAAVNILNGTGLIKDWNLTGYIENWNSTGYIKNWNNTNLIINWSLLSQGYNSLSNFTDNLGNRGYTSLSNFSNNQNFWNSTFATFNKTYADTLYSGITEPLWSGNKTSVAFTNTANTFTQNQNMSNNNITVSCVIFTNGGKWCSA